MNALFGDATTAMPTPATQAERGSLMGVGSPASLDIRRGAPAPDGLMGADAAIPGLDIDPPDIQMDENGKPIYGDAARGRRREGSVMEGVGGWISRMVSRSRVRGDSEGGQSGGSRVRRGRGVSDAGSYRRVQGEED